MKMVKIDCSLIKDWESFHQCFREGFGFPAFYGNNMNAWIDCMSSLDETFSEVRGGSRSVAYPAIRKYKVIEGKLSGYL